MCASSFAIFRVTIGWWHEPTDQLQSGRMTRHADDTRPTRRDLLKTLTLILAPALPATRLEAQAPSHVMNALSTYMSGAATRELPAEVVEHAKHHIARYVRGDDFRIRVASRPGRAAICQRAWRNRRGDDRRLAR